MDTNIAPDVRPTAADRPPSLHQKIYDEIEGNILSGAWPPGHRLQFEVELAAHYGCSRMTVNKVLTQMVKAGLIERRRKSGSFVAYPRAESAILDIRDIKQEVEALGLAYGYERLTRLKRPSLAEDRKRLEVTPTDTVLALTARHRAGRKAFCLENRLINLTAVPEAEAESFETIAPGPWLLGRVPWSSAEHSVRAVAADTKTAELLGITARSPCLVIERRTWNAGAFLTFVRLTYPGDRHALVAHFTPSKAK